MPGSLDPIFRPQTVAVIGASTDHQSLGRQLLDTMVKYGFRGRLFPVNPKVTEIAGLQCYPNILAIPEPVQMAVVVVPSQAALAVLEECGQKGVRGVVMITAGFREIGAEGAALEAKVVELARRNSFRLVGPNCMGVINADPAVRLNATFAPTSPVDGNVAFLSQSGALGIAILNIAEERNLGLSSFASLGNKADVTDDDLVEYWSTDPRTSVMLMYLESFSNPARFAKVARAISRQKPILVVKSGKTIAGARAAASHTGALAAASDAALDAFLEHCGVQRVATVEELFDLGIAFARNPLPAGSRVAIISNAGGPAILATDALVAQGLEMAQLAPATLDALRKRLPAHASVTNPLDTLPGAGADLYRFALSVVLNDPGVDMAMVIYVPPMLGDPVGVIGAIESVRHEIAKPIVGVLMAPKKASALVRESQPNHLALCQFPESAAGALAALDRQRRWCARGAGREPKWQVDRNRVHALISSALAEGRNALHLHEAFEALEGYGIPVARYRTVRSAEEAEDAARALTFPVAMKLTYGNIAHKTEARAVALNVRSTDQAFHTYYGLTRGGSLGDTVVVQEMVAGRETIIGMVRDPTVGPLIMFGLGGIFVETIRDVAFRPVPLTDLDARELIRAIRGYPALAGVRGQKPVDFARLEESITRLSQLVSDFDAIEELDMNPFFASELAENCAAADARIRLRPPNCES